MLRRDRVRKYAIKSFIQVFASQKILKQHGNEISNVNKWIFRFDIKYMGLHSVYVSRERERKRGIILLETGKSVLIFQEKSPKKAHIQSSVIVFLRKTIQINDT